MTIDHKEMAVTLLGVSITARHPDVKDRTIATAQVHATLAVAEQARIANLIAATRRGDDYMSRIYAMNDGPLAAIREGLGIR